jgi:acetyltransferase-like isoleucine patch superfamily enzyme
VIGAGSVVTKSVPADSIAVGVPARVVGTRGDPVEELIDPAGGRTRPAERPDK